MGILRTYLQVPAETDSASRLSQEDTRMENFTISLAKLSERVNMEVVYTPCELSRINVEIAEVNRPGLFLAGYYEYFDNLRLQIMGLAEMNFLSVQTPERRYEALDHLFGQMPPAVDRKSTRLNSSH